MKQVTYLANQKLGCGCPPANVMLCIPAELTADGTGFIPAVLVNARCANSVCGGDTFSYDFTYDEALLVDVNVPLESCDINGVFCDGCFAQYVRSLSSPFRTYPGDPYTYIMPQGPPPAVDMLLSVDSVVGSVVTLAWTVV